MHNLKQQREFYPDVCLNSFNGANFASNLLIYLVLFRRLCTSDICDRIRLNASCVIHSAFVRCKNEGHLGASSISLSLSLSGGYIYTIVIMCETNAYMWSAETRLNNIACSLSRRYMYTTLSHTRYWKNKLRRYVRRHNKYTFMLRVYHLTTECVRVYECSSI